MGWMALSPRKLKGSVSAQPSKSAAHRALCCAALADGVSTLTDIALSDDVRATLAGIQALGLAEARADGNRIMVRGGLNPPGGQRSVDCNESGSTLRFLLPMALISGEGARFTGRGRLMQRPMDVYRDVFSKSGVTWSAGGKAIAVSGRLRPGDYAMPGNVSSQFLTGLLLALPVLHGDSNICLTSPLESRGYVGMTREMQARFGVRSAFSGDSALNIPGGQCYEPARVRIEGDFSHAAFFLVAGALGGDVTVTGLPEKTRQGDGAIVGILREMGAHVEEGPSGVRVGGGRLKGIEIDASQIPDLVPVLCAAACAAEGETRILNAARLRFKESDRLSTAAGELGALGADILEDANGLVIRGTGTLRGGACSSRGDHRMAMALAVASCICEEEVIIEGWECVRKSAAAFWDEFRKLGGSAVERNVGEQAEAEHLR
jgi:3-phosphoshikimate 1-carboxyvinyltransferase